MKIKKGKELKSKELRVNMTASDYAALRERFQSTTHRCFSEFIRCHLRGEPVIKKYRNESLDAILEALVDIKNAVRATGGSLSDADIECIKFLLNNIYERCGQGGSGLRR